MLLEKLIWWIHSPTFTLQWFSFSPRIKPKIINLILGSDHRAPAFPEHPQFNTHRPFTLKSISAAKYVVVIPTSPAWYGFNSTAASIHAPCSCSLYSNYLDFRASKCHVHSKCRASIIPSALNAFLLHFVLYLFILFSLSLFFFSRNLVLVLRLLSL